MILANAGDIIEAADLTGKNKATALAALTAAVPEDGKWVATASATGFKPFPMWGDIGTKTISENMEKQSIQLLRMMARVDVTVNLDDEDNVPPFTLTSIHVYNYNTHGTVAPGSELKDGAVTAPTVPTASTLTKGPVLYDGIDGDNNQCVREIYIMEAKNHKDNGEVKAQLDRTCLVIGGKYGTDGKATYYRVDFSTGSGISQEYLDVLRNHQYIINITKVSGSGYGEPEIAFRSAPVNIQAEVLAWNQVGMNILTTDGQYTLAVSKDAYTFTKEEKNAKDDENTLHIWTDYTTGWKVEKCVDADDETKTADWLSLSPAGAVNNGSQPTETFIGLQENDKGSTRRAKIILAAGRLRKEIVVEQTAVTEFAGSNIVWKVDATKPDGGYLTFSTGPDDKSVDAQAQGVYFKWGSLVAVSGQGVDESAFDVTNHVLFKPSECGTSIGKWADIPYADGSASTATNSNQFTSHAQTDDDFADYNNSVGYNAALGVGDICRYISGKGWVEGNWRLPTSAEYQALLEASGKSPNTLLPFYGSPVGSPSRVTSTDKNGEFRTSSNVQLSGLFFPAAGFRHFDGSLNNVGELGYHWSCSSYSSRVGYYLSVESFGASWDGPGERVYGFSVRCVRE